MSEDVNEIVVEEPYGFIYITTNMCNGKRYLGRRKFSEDWEYYLGSGTIFKKAVEKYGRKNFVRDIIDIAHSEEELNQKEYEYSVFLNVVDSDNWYNLVYGGGTTTGYHMSDETKLKISNAKTGKLTGKDNPMYGRCHTEAAKKKISIANKENNFGEKNPMYGKRHKEESKQKMSNALKGKYAGKNSPHYGKHMPEEQKIRMSKTKKRNWIDKCIAIYSPEFKRIFLGTRHIMGELGYDNSGITKCCKGKLKSCGKHPETKEPLHWFYVLDQVQDDGSIIQGAITLGYITQQDYDNYLNKTKQEMEGDNNGETAKN